MSDEKSAETKSTGYNLNRRRDIDGLVCQFCHSPWGQYWTRCQRCGKGESATNPEKRRDPRNDRNRGSSRT